MKKPLKDMTQDELTSWVCDYFSEPEALEAVERAYELGRQEARKPNAKRAEPKSIKKPEGW